MSYPVSHSICHYCYQYQLATTTTTTITAQLLRQLQLAAKSSLLAQLRHHEGAFRDYTFYFFNSLQILTQPLLSRFHLPSLILFISASIHPSIHPCIHLVTRLPAHSRLLTHSLIRTHENGDRNSDSNL